MRKSGLRRLLRARLGPARNLSVHEDLVWQRLLRGAMILVGGVLGAQSVPLLAGGHHAWTPDVSGIIYGTATLAAATQFYPGLVHWNRGRSSHVNANESLNGTGAVLVVMSGISAFLPGTHDPGIPGRHHILAFLHQQVAVAGLSAVTILVLTTICFLFMGDLARDGRLWLIAFALSLLFGPALTAVLSPQNYGPPAQATGLLVAVLLVVAAGLPRVHHRMGNGSPRATSAGAIVVVMAAVTTLVVSGVRSEASVLPTVYAAASVTFVSAQLLTLIRELEQIATARQQAMTDELTGIGNRRALITGLERNLTRGIPTTLMVIDLDDFKMINDKYGHAVGDDLLRLVADVFASQLPHGATLARLGGDEFAVLMKHTTAQKALTVAHRLLEATAPYRDLEGRPVRVRASIGIATAHTENIDGTDAGDGVDGTELMRRADTAMYQAKTTQSGVFGYDEQLDARAREQLDLLEDLRAMLEDGSPQAEQLEVFYQPQLDITTGNVVGAEALVRWQHPHLGTLTPDRFLGLVERYGLMAELTAHVMLRSVTQWHRFRAAGHPLRISVNLSTSCLAQQGLLRLVDDVIAAGVDPHEFVLEITETALMSDPELALATMASLAARGFRISIDDYGTGYSSLSYLNDLPADELKIDRAFVSRLLSDDRTAAIVAGTIELAHRLGMTLVAEGVEDTETFTLLKQLGCDESQGYLHGRPMPADDLLTWLNRTRIATTA